MLGATHSMLQSMPSLLLAAPQRLLPQLHDCTATAAPPPPSHAPLPSPDPPSADPRQSRSAPPLLPRLPLPPRLPRPAPTSLDWISCVVPLVLLPANLDRVPMCSICSISGYVVWFMFMFVKQQCCFNAKSSAVLFYVLVPFWFLFPVLFLVPFPRRTTDGVLRAL